MKVWKNAFLYDWKRNGHPIFVSDSDSQLLAIDSSKAPKTTWPIKSGIARSS